MFPFAHEIQTFSNQILFLYIDFDRIPLSKSRFRPAVAWRREATARNYLIDGVKQSRPAPNDLVLLCDVDEIITREAIHLIRRTPPVHYYNLPGILYFYSFRWRVGEWKRPLVIRFGSIRAPLDDYKFMPFLCPLSGTLHHHCSFCFPDLREIIMKLQSFSHIEWSAYHFHDPNYLWARIQCGYSVIPLPQKRSEKLTLVEFDSRAIHLPKHARLNFLRDRMSFRDISQLALNVTRMRMYLPSNCTEAPGKGL
jgi:hypothetical protein